MRVALTYVHYHVSSRQLVGSCCISQGAQLGALERPRGWDEGQREAHGGGAYVYIKLIHFLVKQKLIQHCKAMLLLFL